MKERNQSQHISNGLLQVAAQELNTQIVRRAAHLVDLRRQGVHIIGELCLLTPATIVTAHCILLLELYA
eukprot:2198728-Amphidinium_carterae.1